jgi:hypothetical protein
MGLASNINVMSPEEPCSFTEAMASPEAQKWLAACIDELDSIKNLKVFRLVPRNAATGHTIMDGKFVFKLKCDENGTPVCWKGQFIVKGYAAIHGIDYDKTTAPTVQMETFQAVTHVAAANDWVLHQIDVKTTFLRGELEPGQEVYMKQPKGFEKNGLYSLPQGGKACHKCGSLMGIYESTCGNTHKCYTHGSEPCIP